MIQEVTMYTIDCDNCGKNCDEDSDYSCWNDKETAIHVAKDNHNWIEEKGKFYCDHCWSYDDNDNIVIKQLP